MPQPLISNGISNPSGPNGDDTRHTVVGIVADVLDLGSRDLADDATLLDLGAESLMFVEIVLKLERTYGIRIVRSYALPSFEISLDIRDRRTRRKLFAVAGHPDPRDDGHGDVAKQHLVDDERLLAALTRVPLAC